MVVLCTCVARRVRAFRYVVSIHFGCAAAAIAVSIGLNQQGASLLQAFNDLVKKATGGLLLKDIVPQKADGTNQFGIARIVCRVAHLCPGCLGVSVSGMASAGAAGGHLFC